MGAMRSELWNLVNAVLNKMEVTDLHENEKIRNGAEKKVICREIIVMLKEEKQKEKANFVTLKNRKNARFRTSARTYAIFHTRWSKQYPAFGG